MPPCLVCLVDDVIPKLVAYRRESDPWETGVVLMMMMMMMMRGWSLHRWYQRTRSTKNVAGDGGGCCMALLGCCKASMHLTVLSRSTERVPDTPWRKQTRRSGTSASHLDQVDEEIVSLCRSFPILTPNIAVSFSPEGHENDGKTQTCKIKQERRIQCYGIRHLRNAP